MNHYTPTSVLANKQTQSAYLWTSILNTPLWAIFNMLPFILYRDLKATPLQITAMIILKPAVSLIALYWGAFIENRKDRLLSNLIWARILSHVPFFFFPFVNNPWYFVFAFGCYMTLHRGTIPAWMEVLKINVPNVSRERVFAFGSALGYFGAAILPFALGGLMDTYYQSWRWIFPITALISLTAIFFKSKIPITSDNSPPIATPPFNLTQWLMQPWKSAWTLIRRRPDYARYQLGFMLAGSGLIIMQPIFPVYFMERLNLSYVELAVALTLFKGVGFALASPTWAQLLNRINIYKFNSRVTLLASLFPLCLIAAQMNLEWLYFGYILYGVMQAGSEMSWHLSGPLFAKEEDSSVYSSINVLTVGLRGCFIPAIGALLFYPLNATGVMLLGGLLCFLSTLCMAYYSRQVTAIAPAE